MVKHFRFEVRGKKRLHKTPTRRHVGACRPGLQAELARCRLDLCWRGRFGSSPIMEFRSSGKVFAVVPTIHPSFVLRSSGDRMRRGERFDLLVSGLRTAKDVASG